MIDVLYFVVFFPSSRSSVVTVVTLPLAYHEESGTNGVFFVGKRRGSIEEWTGVFGRINRKPQGFDHER